MHGQSVTVLAECVILAVVGVLFSHHAAGVTEVQKSIAEAAAADPSSISSAKGVFLHLPVHVSCWPMDYLQTG